MDLPTLARRLRRAAEAGQRATGHLNYAVNQVDLMFHELESAVDALFPPDEKEE